LKKIKVLYCDGFNAPYIETEKKLLEESFDILYLKYTIKKNVTGKLYNVVKSLLLSILYVPKVDVVYSFFAGYHCFFPVILGRLLNKRTVITVGGFEAVNVPSLAYGIFFKKNLLRWVVVKEYQLSDFILPVDSSLEESINYYADPSGKGYRDGIRSFVPDLKDKFIEVPTGYDCHKFYRQGDIVRKRAVLTVGWVSDEQTFYRKGFDMVLSVAALMKDIPFTIAGLSKEMTKKFETNIPQNVTVHEFVDHETLISLFSSHKVYLQLSLSEGLPNTLCEAMLCECIPIGSNVNGIPKAIGDTGFILRKKNLTTLTDYINAALKMDDNFGRMARSRIINMFPLAARSNKLKAIFEGQNIGI